MITKDNNRCKCNTTTRVYAHTGEWEHEVEWRLKGRVALLTKLLVDLKAFIGLKSSVVGPIVSVAGAVAIEFRLNGPFLPLIPCKLSKHDVKKRTKQKIQKKTKKDVLFVVWWLTNDSGLDLGFFSPLGESDGPTKEIIMLVYLNLDFQYHSLSCVL